MTELTQRRIGVIYVDGERRQPLAYGMASVLRPPLYLPAARLVAQDEGHNRRHVSAADQMSWHCSFASTGPVSSFLR